MLVYRLWPNLEKKNIVASGLRQFCTSIFRRLEETQFRRLQETSFVSFVSSVSFRRLQETSFVSFVSSVSFCFVSSNTESPLSRAQLDSATQLF